VRNQLLISIGVLSSLLALAWSVMAQTGGQAYTAPRTPWGDPDLQGQWNSQTATPLERPLTGLLAEKESLTDEEAENVEQANRARIDSAPATGDPGTYNSFWNDIGKGLNRASLILDPPDGRVPAYTPAAEQRLAAERAERATRGPADSYADLPIWTRCITRGWNGIGSNYSSNTQIFQSPGYVVVLQELIHEPRIIPLDGRPGLPRDVQPWLGVSRGHFEGDTLVVETRNIRAQATYRNASENLVITERFAPIDENTLSWEVRFEDPDTWAAPWAFEMPLKRDAEAQPFEYGCHEGNLGLANILSAARATDGEREQQ
jgi:hypothetical protein